MSQQIPFYKQWKETLAAAVEWRYLGIGTAALAVTGFLRLLAERGVTWAADIPYWLIVVAVVLGTAAYSLLTYANRLRMAALSALRIDYAEKDGFIVTEPFNSIDPAIRTIRVKVTNTGSQTILDCLAMLETMTKDGKPANAFVPVGLSTQHQVGEKRDRGEFALRGGQPKFVMIASLDETKSDSEIMLHYETDKYRSFVARGDYQLSIAVYGGAAVCRKSYRLFVDGGRLRMIEIA